MNPAWLVPTVRAIPWQPLAGVAACLTAVCVLAIALGRWPVGVLDVAAAGLAAAVVAGLRDPAADLLSAMPTSTATRRAHRLRILVPTGLALWMGYLAAGHLWASTLGWPVGPFVALVATGSAVVVWAPSRLAVEAGVAAPLLWLALARGGAGLDPDHQELLFAFEHHPWIVIVAAVAAVLMGGNR